MVRALLLEAPDGLTPQEEKTLMRMFEIMTPDVQTISPNEDTAKAWSRMRAAGIHHLVVVEKDAIVGVVSERDLGGRAGPKQKQLVSDVMNRHVVTIEPDATVRRAANLLRGRSIGCLPVMRGEDLLGIVTTTDLLELLGRGTERPIARNKRFTLTHRPNNIARR